MCRFSNPKVVTFYEPKIELIYQLKFKTYLRNKPKIDCKSQLFFCKWKFLDNWIPVYSNQVDNIHFIKEHYRVEDWHQCSVHQFSPFYFERRLLYHRSPIHLSHHPKSTLGFCGFFLTVISNRNRLWVSLKSLIIFSYLHVN